MSIIAQNRKARYEYTILQEYDAGIVLAGTEIKSLRQGRASITEGYVAVDKNSEVWAYNINIPIYKQSSNYFNHQPDRKRKLLLTKKEINKLAGSVKEKGLTIVPLSLYMGSKGFAKLKIALAKGKKLYDKRETIKKKRHIKRTTIFIKKQGKNDMTPEEDLELYESITEYQNVAESMQTEINDDLDIDEKEKEEYLFPMIEKIKKMADKLIVEYVKYIKNKNDKILVENLTTHLEEIIEEIDIFRDEVYNYYRKKSEKNILTKLV